MPLPGILQEQYGSFINTMYNPLLSVLHNDTATAFRFIYLATYIDYESGYVIWNNRRVTDSDLKYIFGVSRNLVTSIKQGLYDNMLITTDSDGYIIVNPRYCYKGSSNTTKQQYTRVFINSIRELYNKSVDPREHKMMGRLILILPYVNVWHNIICLNIKEKDMSKLVLPNLAQLDSILGVSNKNASRTLKDLLSITVGGEPALLNISHNKANMYAINPRIYYGGTHATHLEELQGYFTAKGGKD